jgi:hypothetical protein
MIDDKTKGMLKIADKHLLTLQEALDDMHDNYPFSEQFIKNMSKSELRTLETMTSRFGKLQDLVGTKIIDLYLLHELQPIEGLSILDKVHKLEKLHVLDNAEIWRELRDVRNNISHEYPDNPELAAKQLNNVYRLASVLISIYYKLSAKILN